LKARADERNSEVKVNTEHAFQAIVCASSTREKAGMQRVGAIESALMDIAAATAMAMHQLQV
jgi:L-alanine-DL-glutamate epimerase-like enolase superfamily enzyme